MGVGAEVGEVGGGVDGGKIAVATVEGLLESGDGFGVIAFAGVGGGEPILVDGVSLCAGFFQERQRLIVISLDDIELPAAAIGQAAVVAEELFAAIESGQGFREAPLEH